MTDEVNNPSWYNKAGIEVIDVIETYAKTDFRLANVIKYVCRCEYKGKKLQDLQKAAWYLNRVIEELQDEEEEDERAYVEQFVQPSPDRIAGDDAAASRIKARYYKYDPSEVLYTCANPSCRQGISASDASWIMDNGSSRCCTRVCLEMMRATR